MIPSQRTQKSEPLDPAPLHVRVMRTVQLGSGHKHSAFSGAPWGRPVEWPQVWEEDLAITKPAFVPGKSEITLSTLSQRAMQSRRGIVG